LPGAPADEIEAWNRQFLNYEARPFAGCLSGQREALAQRARRRDDLTLWVHLTDMEGSSGTKLGRGPSLQGPTAGGVTK
jgi:hypothetical protein